MIIRLNTDGTVADLSSKYDSLNLDSCKEAIGFGRGDLIEIVQIEYPYRQVSQMIVDEDGLGKGLARNNLAYGLYTVCYGIFTNMIVGNVLILTDQHKLD